MFEVLLAVFMKIKVSGTFQILEYVYRRISSLHARC